MTTETDSDLQVDRLLDAERLLEALEEAETALGRLTSIIDSTDSWTAGRVIYPGRREQIDKAIFAIERAIGSASELV